MVTSSSKYTKLDKSGTGKISGSFLQTICVPRLYILYPCSVSAFIVCIFS